MCHDILHKVSSGVVHPPCGTRRAERARLAGKSDKAFLAAIVANNADETSVEQATVEVFFELALNMCRQTETVLSSVAHLLEKTVEVLVDDLIENGFFWLAPAVRALSTGRAARFLRHGNELSAAAKLRCVI